MIVAFETADGKVEVDLHGEALQRVIQRVSKGVGGITFQPYPKEIEKSPSPIALLLKRGATSGTK